MDNQFQFQPGLSMHEFFDLYGSEPQCAQALERALAERVSLPAL